MPEPRWATEGQALGELLTEGGQRLNVSALARAAGLQRQDVYRWLRGENRPSTDKRARLVAGATALGIGVTDDQIAALYGESFEPRPLSLAEAIKAQAEAISAQTVTLGRIAATLEQLTGYSPDDDPGRQPSPGDSTVLRSIAERREPAPTRQPAHPREEALA